MNEYRKGATERAAEYIDLCMTDPAAADRMMSRLARHSSQGLPGVVHDPTHIGQVLEGPAVVAGAALHLGNKGADRDELPTSNPDFQQKTYMRRESLLAQFRVDWRNKWEAQFVPYSREDYMEAMGSLNTQKNTSDLPYDVLCVSSDTWNGHRSFHLAVQNVMLFTGKVPRDWMRQPTYGTLKPGRDSMELASQRYLSLCKVELRTMEALLGTRTIDLLWKHAGPEQMGRVNCLFSVFVDLEVHLIREALNLPSGDLFTNAEDAFDTTTPEMVTV